METTYRIINDAYSNNADEMTLSELRDMCADLGWDAVLRVVGDNILDERNEVVAVAI